MAWFGEELPPVAVPATWAWDDAFGQASTALLRGAEIPEGWTRYKNEPPPSDWGRVRGHHPPRDPISNFEWQTMQQYKRVKHEVYNRTNLPKALVDAVKKANEDVVRALRDSSQVDALAAWSNVAPGGALRAATWKATGYRACLAASRADANFFDQQQFSERCEKWIAQVRRAKEILSAHLGAIRKYDKKVGRKVTEVSKAEIQDSLVDQSVGMQKRWGKTVDPGLCEDGPLPASWSKIGVFCIPPAVQWLAIGTVAYMIFQVAGPAVTVLSAFGRNK